MAFQNQTGPAASKQFIADLGLPQNVADHLQRQRASETQCLRAAGRYHELNGQKLTQARDAFAHSIAPKGQPAAITQWESAVDSLVSGGMSRAQACKKLVSTRPDLHKAMLDAHNEQVRHSA